MGNFVIGYSKFVKVNQYQDVGIGIEYSNLSLFLTEIYLIF